VLDDAATRTCVEAERALNRALDGSCQVPIAAFATLQAGQLRLHGLVGDAGDGRIVRADGQGDQGDPEALGRRVAGLLLEAGAGALL